jgi:oxygen-dependent protoporphyrinogen oxidase
MTHDVVVIGAGVSGLATAHDLAAQGYDVQVLERQVTIGGNAISERFDGYLMEHGPSTLNASVSGAMERIQALGLGETAGDLGSNVRKRYLVDNDKLSAISVHPLGFLLSGYLSPASRLTLATEIFRPRKRGGEEETIHAFVTRRFGHEFADKVIDPMAAGLFMGDSRKLSINGAFPKLAGLEEKFGSITRGILHAKRGSEPGRRLYSWAGGMGEIPKTLASSLAGRIHVGTTVTRITPTPNGFDVVTANAGTLKTKTIVLAVQPHVAAGLLDGIDPEGAAAAREIAAPAIGVVFLGYRKEQVSHPLDGLGFLSTKSNNRIISGAQFCSTMFEGRAPEGHVSISCYTGGARNPELANIPDTDLVNMVTQELSDLLGIKGKPVVARTRRWTVGLPQYGIGHLARQQVLETTNDRLEGMFITGNFIKGVSVANCIDSARNTATHVETVLREEKRSHHSPYGIFRSTLLDARGVTE